jgi:hypothetical protein
VQLSFRQNPHLPGATQTLSGAAITEFGTSVVTLTRWKPTFPFGMAQFYLQEKTSVSGDNHSGLDQHYFQAMRKKGGQQIEVACFRNTSCFRRGASQLPRNAMPVIIT